MTHYACDDHSIAKLNFSVQSHLIVANVYPHFTYLVRVLMVGNRAPCSF